MLRIRSILKKLNNALALRDIIPGPTFTVCPSVLRGGDSRKKT